MRVIQLAGQMSGSSAEVAPRCDKCFVALLSVPQNQNGFIRRLRGKPVIWHQDWMLIQIKLLIEQF